MLIAILLIGLCALREFRVEAGTKVFFEDVIIVHVDGVHFNPETIAIYIVEDETEENSLSSTLEVIKTPPLATEARFALMGLSMGKYNLPTGVDIKWLLCDMLEEPIILGPLFAVMGFVSCPLKTGNYTEEGYKLPMDVLPDEFPENKYVAHFEIYLKGVSLLAVDVYTNVQSD